MRVQTLPAFLIIIFLLILISPTQPQPTDPMKKKLRIIALVLVVAAVGFWAAKGANTGWTKDSREVKTVDEVTGIEGITYKKQFVPGVDFIGAALLGAGILTGVSFLFRTKSNSINQTKQ